MSKSLGNVTLVHDLLKEWDGEVIRLALLKAHYRSELNWSEDLLRESKANLDGLYRTVLWMKERGIDIDDIEPYVRDTTLCNDLDVHSQIRNIIGYSFRTRELIAMKAEDREINGAFPVAIKSAKLLGLLQKDPEDWFKGNASSDDQAEFDAIALRRQEARAAKDWAAADAARDEATAKGIVLEDGPDGTSWRKA